MNGSRLVVWVLGIAFAAACGSGEVPERARADADPNAAEAPRVKGAPEVEKAYQERIDEAWQEAVSGVDPSTSCRALKGRAAIAERGAADRALAACSVDIPVRYFLTYLDRVEAGEKTCVELMTEMMTRLPAMTMSTDGLRDLARAGDEADTSDAAAVGEGTVLLASAVAGGGASDSRKLVEERLRERMTALCPGEAGAILR